jgi:hypothetical protein
MLLPRNPAISALLWFARQTWKPTVVITGGVLLLGAGVNAMYSEGYIAASICFFVAVVWLTARILASEERTQHEHKGAISALLIVVGAVAFGGLLLWERLIYTGKHPSTQSVAQIVPHTAVMPKESPSPSVTATPTITELPTPKRQRATKPTPSPAGSPASRAYDPKLDEILSLLKKPTPTPPKEPTFTEDENVPFTVIFGNGTMRLGKDQKEMKLLVIGNLAVAKAYVENNRIYIDANLSDGGPTPVELKHNRLTFENQRWDRNYDDSALEIVNEDLVPIFQLVYRNARTAIVRGTFINQGALIVADEHGILINPTLGQRAYFKRIFKYPSRMYKGQELETDHQ